MKALLGKMPVLVCAALMCAGSAHADDPVQWRVQDGGNGHWYRGFVLGETTWTGAHDAAAALGGVLCCIESMEEREWVFGRFNPLQTPLLFVAQSQTSGPVFGPWVGGYQQVDGAEPNGGWKWLSGSSFDPSETACCNDAAGCPLDEDRLHLYWYQEIGRMSWNDLPDAHCGQRPISMVVEFSADCNNDGIVDYGQILSGQLADTNNNGVPDICEAPPCPGDITGNRVVNGIDLAAILAAWGGGKSQFDCDIDNDGSVGGSDLAIVLAGWGACP
jgi:hypothetical protein